MPDTNSWDECQRSQPVIDRIGHELRTPLTVVIGMCELLRDDLPNDDALKELASRVTANAWLLHAVVERLITDLYQAGYTGPSSGDPYQTDPGSHVPGPDSLLPMPPSQ